jgi:hypothetical protein
MEVVPSGTDEEDALIEFGCLEEWEESLFEDAAIVAEFTGIDPEGNEPLVKLNSQRFEPRHLATL